MSDSATVTSLITTTRELYAADIPLANTASPVTSIRLNFAVRQRERQRRRLRRQRRFLQPAAWRGDDFNANSEAAAQMLQQWYNASGLMELHRLVERGQLRRGRREVIIANNDLQYLACSPTRSTSMPPAIFLNDYYDDEGWWANAWIRAYDLTGNTNFLNMAKTIFSDLTTGWDSTNTPARAAFGGASPAITRTRFPTNCFCSPPSACTSEPRATAGPAAISTGPPTNGPGSRPAA